MPVIILGNNTEVGKLIHLEIDRDKLNEIRDECDHLSEVLKAELIEIKQNKQQQTELGAEVYHKLKNGYTALNSIIDKIDSI